MSAEKRRQFGSQERKVIRMVRQSPIQDEEFDRAKVLAVGKQHEYEIREVVQLWNLKTRFRIARAGNLVNQETTIPTRTKLLEQKIKRENAFTCPIVTSEIPGEYRIKDDGKCAIIDDGHHRKAVCQQLNLDVPEFRVKPDELMVASWSRLFREVQPNNFESIKRKFQLQSTMDSGIGNGQTVILYQGTRYVFNPEAPIYQTIAKTILRREDYRDVSISEDARTRFMEYELSELLGKSLVTNIGAFVEDESLNDVQLIDRDVFVVTPRLEYQEIIEITYIAGFSLVAKATRMILGKTGRPMFLPIPLRFLSDSNLTPEEKTQVLQAALDDVSFEELSEIEKSNLAKLERPYPEKLYAPCWTSFTRAEWLSRHFRKYME